MTKCVSHTTCWPLDSDLVAGAGAGTATATATRAGRHTALATSWRPVRLRTTATALAAAAKPLLLLRLAAHLLLIPRLLRHATATPSCAESLLGQVLAPEPAPEPVRVPAEPAQVPEQAVLTGLLRTSTSHRRCRRHHRSMPRRANPLKVNSSRPASRVGFWLCPGLSLLVTATPVACVRVSHQLSAPPAREARQVRAARVPAR
jgi:hypothetical protein